MDRSSGWWKLLGLVMSLGKVWESTLHDGGGCRPFEHWALLEMGVGQCLQ